MAIIELIPLPAPRRTNANSQWKFYIMLFVIGCVAIVALRSCS